MPKSRFFFGLSTGMFGCPRRSTVERSSFSARRALSGMVWLFPDGGPFKVPGAVCDVFIFVFGGASTVPAVGDAVTAVVKEPAIAALVVGVPTILICNGPSGPVKLPSQAIGFDSGVLRIRDKGCNPACMGRGVQYMARRRHKAASSPDVRREEGDLDNTAQGRIGDDG